MIINWYKDTPSLTPINFENIRKYSFGLCIFFVAQLTICFIVITLPLRGKKKVFFLFCCVKNKHGIPQTCGQTHELTVCGRHYMPTGLHFMPPVFCHLTVSSRILGSQGREVHLQSGHLNIMSLSWWLNLACRLAYSLKMHWGAMQ